MSYSIMKLVLAALFALAAAVFVLVFVSCGDGEVRKRPKHPPPPSGIGETPLGPPTVYGFLIDSSVAVRGRAVTAEQFHVSEVIAGRFEDGGSAPRAVSVRMPDPSWDIGYASTTALDRSVEYLLLLQPAGDGTYRVTVHYPWGSAYKRLDPGELPATRHAGIFEVAASGAVTYRPGGLGRGLGSAGLDGDRTSIAAIKARAENSPGLVGSRLRADPDPHGLKRSP